jgi:hypothetical protein
MLILTCWTDIFYRTQNSKISITTFLEYPNSIDFVQKSVHLDNFVYFFLKQTNMYHLTIDVCYKILERGRGDRLNREFVYCLVNLLFSLSSLLLILTILGFLKLYFSLCYFICPSHKIVGWPGLFVRESRIIAYLNYIFLNKY